MTNQSFLARLAMPAFLMLFLPGAVLAEAKPNIVYILLDDAGYGDLSCYGQKQFSTPNIDRLAAEGMRFTDHYSGSTVCAPTRCCLMTGVHTGHSYVRGNREVKPEGQAAMPADIVTLPRLLKQAGYATGLVGHETDVDGAVDIVPVGVMIHFFRVDGHPGHESEGGETAAGARPCPRTRPRCRSARR